MNNPKSQPNKYNGHVSVSADYMFNNDSKTTSLKYEIQNTDLSPADYKKFLETQVFNDDNIITDNRIFLENTSKEPLIISFETKSFKSEEQIETYISNGKGNSDLFFDSGIYQPADKDIDFHSDFEDISVKARAEHRKYDTEDNEFNVNETKTTTLVNDKKYSVKTVKTSYGLQSLDSKEKNLTREVYRNDGSLKEKSISIAANKPGRTEKILILESYDLNSTLTYRIHLTNSPFYLSKQIETPNHCVTLEQDSKQKFVRSTITFEDKNNQEKASYSLTGPILPGSNGAMNIEEKLFEKFGVFVDIGRELQNIESPAPMNLSEEFT